MTARRMLWLNAALRKLGRAEVSPPLDIAFDEMITAAQRNVLVTYRWRWCLNRFLTAEEAESMEPDSIPSFMDDAIVADLTTRLLCWFDPALARVTRLHDLATAEARLARLRDANG